VTTDQVDRSAGAEYRGPVTVSTFEVLGRPIKLVRPSEPDRLLDDPSVHAWNREDDYMPYWAYLWPGANMLAEAVARCWGDIAGEREAGDEVLELGCGLGLGGLAAMGLGFRVCFSDYDPAALAFVLRSVRENGLDPVRCSTLVLDWREPPPRRFGRIIGADVLYERRLVPLVADVLARMLAPGGEALIATPYRVSAEAFPGAAAAVGLACRAEAVETVAETGAVQPGILYRASAPSRG
jgi:predicted nicotinamide N-methyase